MTIKLENGLSKMIVTAVTVVTLSMNGKYSIFGGVILVYLWWLGHLVEPRGVLEEDQCGGAVILQLISRN